MSPDPHSPVPTWQHRQDRKNLGRVKEVELDDKVVEYIPHGGGGSSGYMEVRDPGDGFQPFPVPQRGEPRWWHVAAGLVVLVVLVGGFATLVTHAIWRG